jgi:hypothetical protein
MKSSETIGVFCENNTKHTPVHTVLGEMQSFLMLQQMEHVVATGLHMVRLRLKCDGTRSETRFRLSAKQTSPFKSAGASVQSTNGSRVVRISCSNAGYTMFWGSV